MPRVLHWSLWLCVFSLLTALAVIPMTGQDTDFWWHLSAGRHMWKPGCCYDVFSHTRFGADWDGRTVIVPLGTPTLDLVVGPRVCLVRLAAGAGNLEGVGGVGLGTIHTEKVKIRFEGSPVWGKSVHDRVARQSCAQT